MIKKILLLACLLLPVSAQNRTMTFEGIPDSAPVNDWYNGGPGGPLGVSFKGFEVQASARSKTYPPRLSKTDPGILI